MSVLVYGIVNKRETEIEVKFVSKETRKSLATALILPTNVPGQYMATTRKGSQYGYRHASVEAAQEAIAQEHGFRVVWVSAAHPAVAQLVKR